MNRFFKFISVFGVIALLSTAYKVQTTQASVPVDYQTMFYKSLDDRSVASFLASHNCTSAGDFQLCSTVGLALQVDSHGLIRQVYLYLNGNDEFALFGGKLPFGITFSDTMADVQQKLGYSKVTQMPILGIEPRLPDVGGTPDHIHYWATYKDCDLTIVYNTPLADNLNASIYMVLISVDPILPQHGHTILT